MDAALSKLMTGVAGQGVLSDNVFTISKLGNEEINQAKPFLRFANGVLSLK
jgi:hypothetical protein